MNNTELCWLARRLTVFCPQHINPEIEIIHVTHGSLHLTYDSCELELHSGEMLLILPYHLHSFSPTEDTDAIVYMFPQAIYHDFMDSYSYDSMYKIYTLEEPATTYLNYLLKDAPQNRNLFYVRSIFDVFANAYLQNTSPLSPYTAPEECISKVVEYIFMHLQEDISVADLARYIGWEPRRLSSAFKAQYSIKITDLISNIRIDRATTLLENSDASISEIASICGFGSLRNFNRIFRMRTGCTPSSYRQKHKQQKSLL